MSVKLREIIADKSLDLTNKKEGWAAGYQSGYNAAIEQLGRDSITLDREKLAKLMQNYFGIIELESPEVMYKKEAKIVTKVANWTLTHGLADEIIANLKDLIIAEAPA